MLQSSDSKGECHESLLSDRSLLRLYRELGLKEHFFGLPRAPRRSTVLVGLGPRADLGTFSDSAHNVRLAVLERVLLTHDDGWKLTVDTRCSENVVDRLGGYARALDLLMSCEEGNAPMDAKAYAAEYPAGKRQIYETAAASLEQRPVAREDSKIKGFIKFEKDVRSDKEGRVPRVISPPSPRYRLATGMYVRPAEERLYKAVNEVWGHTVVAKGLNYDQIGSAIHSHWCSFSDPASLDCDVSKMDKATSWGIRWTNERLASYYTGADKKTMLDLLKWQESYRASIRGHNSVVSYKMRGSLTSGQVNTSAVGVAQVTAVVHAFTTHHRRRLKIINAGDDFTIFGEKCDVLYAAQHLPSWFKEFGFVLEAERVNHVLERVNFCQTSPVNIGGTWRMVRNPRTVALKDPCSLYELRSRKEVYTHFRGVAKGGLASFGGVPVLQDFYGAILRMTDGLEGELTYRQRKTWRRSANRRALEDGSLKWFGEGMAKGYGDVSPATRESFARAFGLEGPFQVGLENYYRGWSCDVGTVIDLRCQPFVNLFPSS